MTGEMIAAVAAVTVAGINGIFQYISTKRTKRRDAAREARDRVITGQIRVITGEVKNHHSTNLRDDVTGILSALAGLTDSVSGIATDVREVRSHSGKLFSLDRDKETRISNIEKKMILCQPKETDSAPKAQE